MILYAHAPYGFTATEEEFICRFFDCTKNGTFVDIGAHVGIYGSNTRELWKQGWCGVLVEPDPQSFSELKKLYDGVDGASRLKLLNVAIATEDGKAKCAQCTLDGHTGWHSLSTGWVATWPEGTARYIEVTTRSIKSLIESGEIPRNVDLLSVDTEGMDYVIIASMPADFRPRVIVAEVDKPAGGKTVRELLDAEMERRSYRFAWGNYLNSVYIRS